MTQHAPFFYSALYTGGAAHNIPLWLKSIKLFYSGAEMTLTKKVLLINEKKSIVVKRMLTTTPWVINRGYKDPKGIRGENANLKLSTYYRGLWKKIYNRGQ